jgi:hypothetical protein
MPPTITSGSNSRAQVFWYSLAFVVAVLVATGVLATVYTAITLQQSGRVSKDITEAALRAMWA